MVRITSFARINETENEIHKMNLVDLQKKFKVDVTTGLSSSRAQELLRRRKLEEIKLPYNRFFITLRMFFKAFFDYLSLVIILSLVCLVIYYEPIGGDSPDIKNLICFGFVLVSLLIFPILIAVNEYRLLSLSAKKTQSDNNSASALVLRDSNLIEVPSNELVVGDIVEITANQHVPADLRLIYVNGLSFDKSIFTGDTESIEASLNNFESRNNSNYYEAKNMAFKNFWVVSGNGRGIVISTEEKSQVENLALAPSKIHLIRRAFIQIALSTLFVSFLCILIFIIVWASYLRTNYNLPVNTIISNILNIVVTGVPYSCSSIMMVGYMIYLRKLNKMHLLIKKRHYIGSLNSIDVVLTDKTGTITKNEFEVTNAYFCEREIDTTKYLRSHSNDFDKFIGMIEVDHKEDSQDPIERAHYQFFTKFHYHSLESKNQKYAYKIAEKIDFSSSNMFHATLFQQKKILSVSGRNLSDSITEKEKHHVELIVIGITDFLLPKCTYVMSETCLDNEKIEGKSLNRIQRKIDKWASVGRKVICFCKKTIDEETFLNAKNEANFNFQKWFNSENTNLTFVGMVGLMDPPQPGIKDTVNQIFELGLRVIMVTGDYSLTSVSMAAQAGIFSSKKYDTLNKFRQNKANNRTFEFSYTRGILLNGPEIDNLSKEEFGLIYSEYYQMIVCRATPNHKLKLVKLLQDNKKSVLMVGDGLNDVSALKQADLSIAMNSGSKLAIEKSDIVILNNSFSSIYELLYTGRKYCLNLQKVFIFCLSSLFTQYASTLLSSVLGIPQLYSNVQMIFFTTFIDFIPSLSLLFEKPDLASIKSAGNMRIFNFKNIMFGLSLGLMTTIFAYISFYLYLLKYGSFQMSSLFFSYFGDPNNYTSRRINVAQSIAFFTIVIIHVCGNLYSVRTMYKSIFETVPLFGSYSNVFMVVSSIIVSVFMILILVFPISGVTVSIYPLFYVVPFVDSIIITLILEGLRFIFLRKKIYPYNVSY